jgi:hypothetical protein
MEPSSTSHQTISTRLHTRLESNAPQALTSTPTQTRLQHESPAPTDAYSPRFTNASPEDSADQLALDLGQLRELRLQTPQTSSVAPLITKGPSNAALQTIETSQNRNLQPPLYASAAQPLHPPVARASQSRRALHQASASLQHPAAVHNPHSTFPEPRHVADAQAPRPHTRAPALPNQALRQSATQAPRAPHHGPEVRSLQTTEVAQPLTTVARVQTSLPGVATAPGELSSSRYAHQKPNSKMAASTHYLS